MWPPSASEEKAFGVAHGFHTPPSSRHWKLEPGSDELNVKLAAAVASVPAGPPVIDVLGGESSGSPGGVGSSGGVGSPGGGLPGPGGPAPTSSPGPAFGSRPKSTSTPSPRPSPSSSAIRGEVFETFTS